MTRTRFVPVPVPVPENVDRIGHGHGHGHGHEAAFIVASIQTVKHAPTTGPSSVKQPDQPLHTTGSSDPSRACLAGVDLAMIDSNRLVL